MMAKRPYEPGDDTVSATLNTTVLATANTHDNAVLADLDHGSDGRGFDDRVLAYGDIVRDLHGVVAVSRVHQDQRNASQPSGSPEGM